MFSFKNIDSKKFEKIYNDMTMQFPQGELKSSDVFKNLIEKKYYEVFLFQKNLCDVGYCIFYQDEESKTLWLDYIAIFKDFRSKGFGSKLFEHLKGEYSNYNGVFLEVEKPDKEDINTIRRIKFYENLGAQKLDCRYFYPNIDGCLAMDLYFMPFNNSFFPSKEEIKSSITNAFYYLHKDIPHVDEVLKKIVI